jgi:hypothetical protein
MYLFGQNQIQNTMISCGNPNTSCQASHLQASRQRYKNKLARPAKIFNFADIK